MRVEFARRSTRRLAWGAGALVLLFGVVLAAAPLFLSGEFVRERVVAHLAETTGATVRVSRSHVALYPRPRVVMENVRLGATHLGGAEAQIDRLEVDVALLPALGGRIVPTALRAERPHLLLRRRVQSTEALAAILPSRTLPWPTLSVRDGRVDWQRGGRTLRVTALDATMSAVGKGGALRGSAVWNGEPVAFETSTPDLAALATKGANARVTLTSSPLSLAFDGTVHLPAGRLLGRATLETVSMERASEWLGLGGHAPAVPASISGDVTAQAVATAASTLEAAFRTAQIRIGDARADGSLTLQRGSRTAVAGTLAFGDIAISAGPLQRALDLASEDARADLRLPHLTALDLDLRLSAARLQLAGTRLDEVAATLRTDRRNVTLAVGDASLGGGRAQGRLRFRTERDGAATTLTLATRDVDLAALPWPASEGGLRADGRADATLTLSARGRDPASMLATLAGQGSLTLRDGRLGGFDLGTAMRATRSGALPRQTQVWRDATPFSRLSAGFTLGGGIATLRELRIRADRAAARLRGRVDLVRGSIALRGAVADASPGRPATFEPQGGFFVGGTLLTPLLVPVEAIEPPPEGHRSG